MTVGRQPCHDQHHRRHPDPQRPRHPDRQSAGFGSDGIGGGHALSLPPPAVGMNGSQDHGRPERQAGFLAVVAHVEILLRVCKEKFGCFAGHYALKPNS